MKKLYLLYILLQFIFCPSSMKAQIASACVQASAQVDLDINNVRARILNGGDMWWDVQSSPGYEVPKGSRVHSNFASSIMLGALDDGGQLYVAAGNYRQAGVDFWPGPLDTATAEITDTLCFAFDKIWKLNRAEVEQFIACRNLPGYVIPENIRTWPGNGRTGQAKRLAPFEDVDSDGIYNPAAGDYPAFALGNTGNNCNYHLQGDQCLWWVFNDKGNTHEFSGGNAMGIEIQQIAFAFRTNTAVNEATFYRYTLINRSSTRYNNMWFGRFDDVDLGLYNDDYTGCDVMRGIGYIYNGTTNDGGSPTPNPGTYGARPPAIGIDFVQGPQADPGDGIDNDRDFVTDEAGERIPMAMFKFWDADFSISGNPNSAQDHYYYLQGKWLDGSQQTYGGYAYGGSTPCMFMFPGNSDPFGFGTGNVPQPDWSEVTANNTPADRRMLLSMGPFTLEPGEVEIITEAVSWARDSGSGNNLAAIPALQRASDSAQALFERCFSIPCAQQAAPEIFAQQSSQGLYWFSASGTATAWRWSFGDGTESSRQFPSHQFTQNGTYQICLEQTTACGTQTSCKTITVVMTEVAGCGPELVRIEGQGCGWQELRLKKETVNEILASPHHRSLFPKYEGMYGPVRIQYENYDQLTDGEYRIAFDSTDFAAGWKMWRVGGTDTVRSDSSIGAGHKQVIEQWGLSVEMQQVHPPGSGLNMVRNGMLSAFMEWEDEQKQWLGGVADDDNLPGSFDWILSGSRNAGNGTPCEQSWSDRSNSNGYIDPYQDFEQILGGTWSPYRLSVSAPPSTATNLCREFGVSWTWQALVSPFGPLTDVAGVDVVITPDRSKWSRCVVFETGVVQSMNQGQRSAHLLRAHASVDKDGLTVAQGALSDPQNPEAADYIGAQGMGWFPGYAINTETGERLNIAFGENSSLALENGSDMRWNPSSRIKTPLNSLLLGGMHYIYVFGHHGDARYPANFMTPELRNELSDVPMYDEGRAIYRIMTSSAASTERREVFRDAVWVTIPVLQPGRTLLETEVSISLRVAKPYSSYATDSIPKNRNLPLYGFTIEKRKLCCNIYAGQATAFPNPFRDETMILFDNRENRQYTLELYDMRGALIHTETTLSDRIFVYGAGLSNGVYFWRLSSADEPEYSGKIIRY
ncbi:MAG: PKD domain-containing protein [Bacteroidia bacterium]|jgi:PKD repeat protein|nr:PKD domain-containing protein [Bacteroidia bacterium]